jgi:hypothetical protein
MTNWKDNFNLETKFRTLENRYRALLEDNTTRNQLLRRGNIMSHEAMKHALTLQTVEDIHAYLTTAIEKHFSFLDNNTVSRRQQPNIITSPEPSEDIIVE